MQVVVGWSNRLLEMLKCGLSRPLVQAPLNRFSEWLNYLAILSELKLYP